MSNYTRLLLILVVLLDVEIGSVAQHDSTTELPARSVHSRTGEALDDKSKSRGHRPQKVEDYTSYAMSNDKKKKLKRQKQVMKQQETLSEESPRYERNRFQMFHVAECVTQRLYNKFFNYAKYELDKKTNDCGPEFLENAFFGAILSGILFIIQLIIHGIQSYPPLISNKGDGLALKETRKQGSNGYLQMSALCEVD